jgi:hypothetical protein
MLNNIIKIKTQQWINSPECRVKSLLQYIRFQGVRYDEEKGIKNQR